MSKSAALCEGRERTYFVEKKRRRPNLIYLQAFSRRCAKLEPSGVITCARPFSARGRPMLTLLKLFNNDEQSKSNTTSYDEYNYARKLWSK
jgi:hypothetical protein